MARYCKYCGYTLTEDSIFCEGCGNAVAAQAGAQQADPQQAVPQELNMNVCPDCGYTLGPGAKFCKECGKAVDALQTVPQEVVPQAVPQELNMNVCPDCGYTLGPGAKFCKECGKAVNAPQDDPQEVVPQQSAKQPQQAVYMPPHTVASAPIQPAPIPPAPIPPAPIPPAPIQPVYQSQRQAPAYTHQNGAPPKKKNGWILPYRIISSVLVVALLVTGTLGYLTKKGIWDGWGSLFGSGSTGAGSVGAGSTGSGDTGKSGGALSDEDMKAREEADALNVYLDALWEDDRTTWLDASSLTRAPIVGAVLQPSGDSVTVELAELSVTVPGGFSDEPLNVTLSEITDMPPIDGYIRQKVYDLDIGGMGALPDTIAVTMPYDPVLAETLEDLRPMVWDDAMGWVARPYSVDGDAHTVTLYTNHLCPIVLGYLATAWATAQVIDTIIEAGKLVHDIYTISMSYKYTTSKGNFTVMYNPFDLWNTIDPESYERDIRGAMETAYEDSMDNPGKPDEIEINAEVKAAIEGGLRRLDALLESQHDVYVNAGYQLGGGGSSYPVTIGMGGEAVRTTVAAAVAYMYLSVPEFLLFTSPETSPGTVEQKLQLSMFKALLGNAYKINTYIQNTSVFVFDTFQPFAWLNDAESWLNGLYGYVPYSLFVSADTSGFAQIVTGKFLNKPIESLSRTEATLLPYYIQKELGLPLAVVVADVATTFGGQNADKIANACGGKNREEWHCDFVTFVYTKTSLQKDPFYMKNDYTVTSDKGKKYAFEYETTATDEPIDKMTFVHDEVDVSRGVIEVSGTGRADLILVNYATSGLGIEVKLKDTAADETIEEFFTRGSGMWTAEIYTFYFDVSEWLIEPDEFETQDSGGDFKSGEFTVTYKAPVSGRQRYNLRAGIDGVQVLEVKNESINKDETNKYEFEITDNVKLPPRELLVEIYDTAGKELLASKTIHFPSDAPTLDELVGYYADGTLTITEVTVDPVYKAALEAAAEGAKAAASEDDLFDLSGCELDPDAFYAMIGQVNPSPLTITKTGENTGSFITGDPSDPDYDSSDGMDFTYTNGVIRASRTDKSDEGTTMTASLEIKAAYGPGGDTIVLTGKMTLVITVTSPEYSGEAIALVMSVAATKPLL